MRVDLPVFDLKYDKIKESIDNYLEFNSDNIIYSLHAYMDKFPSPDDDTQAKHEDVYDSWDIIYLRSTFKSVCIYKDHDSELWLVILEFDKDQLRLKFQGDNERAARKTYKIASQYLLRKFIH